MLCKAMCDAGGPNQQSETIGNLGLWTRPGIPTKATRLKTRHSVRFFVEVPCPDPPKIVMKSVIACGIIYGK